MKNYSILGVGCIEENTIEKNLIKLMSENGFKRVLSLEESDYLIYITCAGVGKTIYKCVDDIKKLIPIANQMNFKLIITGCLTNFNGFDDIKKLDYVKVIKGKDWPIKIMNYILNENKKNTIKRKLENRTNFYFGNNIFVQFMLESGCTNNCTFCKNNYLDKKVISIPYDIALNHLNNLIESGTKSILLSGDNLTLYGIDLCNQQILHKFIRILSKNEKLINIDLGEISVSNMYEELLEEICNNAKVGQVSFQLETASDRLLKLMNRGHNLEQYDYIVRRLKESGKFISTVLLPGFPTETYEDLDKTIKYLYEREIFTESISPYCDFAGIPSSKLEQLSYNDKRKHNKYLKEKVLNNNNYIFQRYLNKERKNILVNKEDNLSVFYSILPVWTISYKKEHTNLDLGDEIIASPKKLIHKSKFNNYLTLKL